MALKVNITHFEGTYTNSIRENYEELKKLFEDRSVTITDFTVNVLNAISKANDTPAKARFINQLSRKKDKVSAMMLVSNAYLAGTGNAVI